MTTDLRKAGDSRPRGVFAAILTPLNADFEPDFETFVAHGAWLLDNGCHGLGVLGTTGEANSLSLASRLGLIEHACAYLPPEKLLIGAGSCALDDAVALTRASLGGGATHVLVLPPFYYKPIPEDGMLRYFSHFIERVGAPELRLYLYNFPQLSGYNFPLTLIRRLKDEFGPVIAGAKDSSGEWDNMAAMCREFEDFDVFAGTEIYLLDILRLGGAGCISATTNVTVRLCRQVHAGPETGDDLQARLTAVRRSFEDYPLIPALKALVGRRSGNELWRNILPPFEPLAAPALDDLVAALSELGFNPSSGLLEDR
jgi:4-hydroxy-tetrahydrodipicolinate synthase